MNRDYGIEIVAAAIGAVMIVIILWVLTRMLTPVIDLMVVLAP